MLHRCEPEDRSWRFKVRIDSECCTNELHTAQRSHGDMRCTSALYEEQNQPQATIEASWDVKTDQLTLTQTSTCTSTATEPD
jgi:hypothetical protein